jgi:hypothetical protein
LLPRSTGPCRIEKTLDFDKITIRVVQKAVVDVVCRIVAGRFVHDNAMFRQIAMPLINIVRHQGQDERAGRRWIDGIAPLTNPEKSSAGNAIDTAGTLIERQRQTQQITIERSAGIQVAHVDERHKLFEW